MVLEPGNKVKGSAEHIWRAPQESVKLLYGEMTGFTAFTQIQSNLSQTAPAPLKGAET